MPDTVDPVAEGHEPEDNQPTGPAFPIVGIGASAGGLQALSELFDALPSDTHMAFVVIQHLDPDHKSQLTEILSRRTAMKTVEIYDAQAVAPDHVYVIPPNTFVRLSRGILHLSARSAEPGYHAPIDAFFRSLAQEQARLSIGIVLSGNGADGSLGIKAIKSHCGVTFAQEERTAQYPNMPRNAIATGAVDFVLPPREIAEEVARISQNRYVVGISGKRKQQEVLPDGDEMHQVLLYLRRSSGVDFRMYKQSTVRRRVGRRMVVQHLDQLGDYLELVKQHPEELKELFKDLLITVTAFFRDSESVELLMEKVSDLMAQKQPGEAFRTWVPACATGEEVYSLAIAIQEIIDRTGPREVQFFGTDISEEALAKARMGVYSEREVADLSVERVQRYFEKVDAGYQVKKVIRTNCVFANQDLTRDPPFAHLDLISCRNLLIYFEPATQSALLPIFHFALNPSGILFLGSAEAIATPNRLFETPDPKHRIFIRKPGPTPLESPFPTYRRAGDAFAATEPVKVHERHELQRIVDRTIQDRYGPDGVVINTELEILYFRGHTGFYLEPPTGEPQSTLLRMARPSLHYVLREAVKNAIEQRAPVEVKNVKVEYAGEARFINLDVLPLKGPGYDKEHYLVAFEQVKEPAGLTTTGAPAAGDGVAVDQARMERLEQELEESRKSIRALVEDQETALEDARAINEELQSANEELQSMNEELGTTKEELQASNEELTTINEEVATRNRELITLTDDLRNFIGAVDIPILMVDSEVKLRRFSPAAEAWLALDSGNIGAPLFHIRYLDEIGTNLDHEVREVIKNLAVQQREICDRAGKQWSAVIRPYRTSDEHIGGAIIAFLDTDQLHRTLHEAEEAHDFAESIIATVRVPLLVLTLELRVQRANAYFYRAFKVLPEETEQKPIHELGNGQWNIPLLIDLLKKVLTRDQAIENYEVEHTFEHIGQRTMLLNARRVSGNQKGGGLILLSIEDVTKQRQLDKQVAQRALAAHQELDRTKEELRALAEGVMHARDEEQRKVARDLHDDVVQRLATLEIDVEHARLGAVRSDDTSVANVLSGLQQQITGISDDIRKMSHRLHPSILEDLGLGVALRSLVRQFQGDHKAKVSFHSRAVPSKVHPEIALAAYRIAQEALRNVQKHAQKAAVEVKLTASRGVLSLEIRNSGRGFRPDAVRGQGGLGITSMYERARAAGGKLDIDSKRRSGTVVTFRVPLKV